VRPSEVTPTQQEVWSGRLTAYTTCNTFAMRGLFDYLLRHYRGAARRFSRDVVHLHLRRSLPPPTPGGCGNGGGAAFGGAATPSWEEAPPPPPPTPSPLPRPPAGTASSPPNGQSSSSSSPAVLASPRTELPNFVNGFVSNWFQPDAPSGGIADGLFPNVVPVPSTPDVDEWVASEAGRLPLASALEQSGESSGAADLTPSLAAEVGDTLAGVGDVFVFSYGVIVAWGLSEVAEEAFTAQMADFEIGSLEGGAENEILDYGYWSAGGVDGAGHPIPGVHAHGGPASAPMPAGGGGGGGSGMETCVRIAQDTVLLSLGLPVDDMVQAKLAVSHAVAQSSKLASFESAVEGVFERIAHLPVSLAQTGRLNISDRELLRLSGELYTYRAYINLQTDILYVGESVAGQKQDGCLWSGAWVTGIAFRGLLPLLHGQLWLGHRHGLPTCALYGTDSPLWFIALALIVCWWPFCFVSLAAMLLYSLLPPDCTGTYPTTFGTTRTSSRSTSRALATST